MSDIDAIREAYRLGYERGTYDCGGSPVDGPHFANVEAADLQRWLGEERWHAELAQFLGRPPAETPVPEVRARFTSDDPDEMPF